MANRYLTSGIKSTPSEIFNELEKIQDAQADLLSRTGENPNEMEANFDMNNNRILNLPAPISPTEPLRLADITDGNVTISSVDITTDTVSLFLLNNSSDPVGTVVLCYGYSQAGDGGLSYWKKSANTGTASQTPVQLGAYQFTDADGSVWDLISEPNPVVVGADPTGVLDSTASFNLWLNTEFATAKGTDDGSPVRYGDIRLEIPKGVYSVSSIDATGQTFYRNCHIVGYGVTLVANTAGKNVVDCVGSRWLWFWGLTVMSPQGIGARAGFQLGNIGAEALGNNKFFGVQAIGNFTLAAAVNSGSETTQWYSCRFSNQNTTAGTYAFVGDGQNQLGPYTSDYVTVTKTQGTPVSFTNNAFYGCQFRHIGGQGAVYLSRTEGWLFDESCYFLSYDEASITLYTAGAARTVGLSVAGLHETKQTAPPYGAATGGLQDIIRFTGDGSATLLQGINLKLRRPVSANAVLATDGTTGNIELSGAIIEITNTDTVATQTLISPTDSGVFTISGEVKVDRTAFLNLDILDKFTGTIITDTKTGFNSPVAGAYRATFYDDNETWDIGTNKVGTLSTGWNIVVPAGGNMFLEGKLNAVTLSTSYSVTDFVAATDNPFLGLEEVIIRTSGSSGTLTIVNNTAKLRTLSGANVVMGDNDAMHFIKVDAAGTAWQQIGGTV